MTLKTREIFEQLIDSFLTVFSNLLRVIIYQDKQNAQLFVENLEDHEQQTTTRRWRIS